MRHLAWLETGGHKLRHFKHHFRGLVLSLQTILVNNTRVFFYAATIQST